MTGHEPGTRLARALVGPADSFADDIGPVALICRPIRARLR
ncbi:hypothetical protein [Streptomyces sp. NPDC015414]